MYGMATQLSRHLGALLCGLARAAVVAAASLPKKPLHPCFHFAIKSKCRRASFFTFFLFLLRVGCQLNQCSVLMLIEAGYSHQNTDYLVAVSDNL
jgi:hypothetical protein